MTGAVFLALQSGSVEVVAGLSGCMRHFQGRGMRGDDLCQRGFAEGVAMNVSIRVTLRDVASIAVLAVLKRQR